jgi:hypothetical protein
MSHPNRHYTRRWFQLSLRSIFLLMLVVAAYFAGYRTAVRQAEQAQQAEQEARLQAEREAAKAKRAEEATSQAAILSYLKAVQAAQAIRVQQDQASLEAKKAATTAELEPRRLIKKEYDREHLPPFEGPKPR